MVLGPPCPTSQLFDQLPTSGGVLALQIFGPITALLSFLGITAATLDLKLLLLLVRAMPTLTSSRTTLGVDWLSLRLQVPSRGVRPVGTHTHCLSLVLLQFSALVLVEFVAVIVVASPLLRIQTQVGLSAPRCPLLAAQLLTGNDMRCC